ncbi:MAG: transglutaminase-like domain-containing protein [Nanoarchaeota archaeon]
MRFLIILFLLIIVSVNAEDFNAYKELDLRTELSSSLSIENQGGSVRYVYANLTFFPLESDFQEFNYKIFSSPKASQIISKDNIYFKWDYPNEDRLEFNVDAEGTTKVNFQHLKNKIDFPIKDNLVYLNKYLVATETVNSNDPNIIAKANELAQGEDDLFELVHKIGTWNKQNINYSLETLTAEVSQNASWVLENRIGVCDELTSLFVSMLRSLNIPARFVTGQSYTNLLNDFGNHAWAEVYFPGYGWIPFDPTYGQFGYVDATHIRMKVGADIKESDINYGWLSSNANVVSLGLDIKSMVLNTGEFYKEDVELGVDILKNDVGPGSHVPIKVTAKNLNSYYLPLTVYLYKAPIKVQDNIHELLLKPNKGESTFFIVKIPDELKKGFIYSSEVAFKDTFLNEVAETLRFNYDEETFSFEEAQELISQLTNEEEKIYSQNINLNCDLDKDFYYDYESGKITCSIMNKGNFDLNDLEICYNPQCKFIDLRIIETKLVDFRFTPEDDQFLVTLNNNEVSKFFIVNPQIYDSPNLELEILGHDSITSYFEDTDIRIKLSVNSPVNNVEIKLNNRKIYELKSFDGEKIFDITLRGYNLDSKNILSISYEDKNNNSYVSEEEFNMTIRKPFYIRDFWIILIILILIVSTISRRKQHLLPYSRN